MSCECYKSKVTCNNELGNYRSRLTICALGPVSQKNKINLKFDFYRILPLKSIVRSIFLKIFNLLNRPKIKWNELYCQPWSKTIFCAEDTQEFSATEDPMSIKLFAKGMLNLQYKTVR